MTDQLHPIILYFRTRPSEEKASKKAMKQQRYVASKLARYPVAGEFTEIETAEPDNGWREERPELAKACELAVATKREHDDVFLILLRMDGIGRGDDFQSPGWAHTLLNKEGVSVRKFCTSAEDAEEAFAEANEDLSQLTGAAYKRIKAQQVKKEKICAPDDAPDGLSAFVDIDFKNRVAHLFLCNCTPKTVKGIVRRQPAAWSERFKVKSGRCVHLETFYQGWWWSGYELSWRFEFEGKREGEVKQLVIPGDRFKHRWRELIDCPEQTDPSS